MSTSWEEIEAASADSRHELHLTGETVSQRVQSGLPDKLFELRTLNYLEIADTTLTTVSPRISQLDNLINLALHRNEITAVPDLNTLKKLKFLDMSFNCIEALPAPLDLPVLHTMNVGNNRLSDLPDFSGLPSLGILHVDHNELTELPSGIEKLTNLSEVHAANNEISTLPEGLVDMAALKHLDLSENKLKEISVDLSLCKKMKELNIRGNPLKDNRLRKMTTQCSTKAQLEYITQHMGGDKNKGGKGKKGKKKKEQAVEEENEDEAKIYVIQPKENCARQVVSKNNVKDVRPYICCTVVKNLDLSSAEHFKKFLAIQTKLHENECDMRTKATIATHNAATVTFPLTYEAVAPEGMEIVPLGKTKKTSPRALIETLKNERDALKLKKKRQPKTGLYKFIDLVDGKDEYACVRNNDGTVISFPPVTNSEQTKITSSVGDVFIEVTSPLSLPQCKHVMEEFIKQMFQAGMRSRRSETSEQGLVLEKVSVVDEEGSQRGVFPSKIDLDFTAPRVERVEQMVV